MVSFGIKSLFVICELAVAIAFGVCMKKGNKQNAAAILEWGKLSALSDCAKRS